MLCSRYKAKAISMMVALDVWNGPSEDAATVFFSPQSGLPQQWKESQKGKRKKKKESVLDDEEMRQGSAWHRVGRCFLCESGVEVVCTMNGQGDRK